MADIVNLRRVRKEKARQERASQAAANRTKFGRSKLEKAADSDARRRERTTHDGRHLQDDQPDEG